MDIKRWNERLKSGNVWGNYFRPFEWRDRDYSMNYEFLYVLAISHFEMLIHFLA